MFGEEIYFLTNCSIFCCAVMNFIRLTHLVLPSNLVLPSLDSFD